MAYLLLMEVNNFVSDMTEYFDDYIDVCHGSQYCLKSTERLAQWQYSSDGGGGTGGRQRSTFP